MNSGTMKRSDKNKYCLACNRTISEQFTHCPNDGALLVDLGLVTPEDLIGVLSERYEVKGRIDSHEAINYLLNDRELNRRVVAKVLRTGEDAEREKERFMRIASALSKLNHPSIPKLISQGIINEQPYMLIEYKDGQTLESVVKERGKIKVSDVCKILTQVSAALRHAHDRGIFHQDLTASDIIAKEGKDQKWEVAVIDFGKGKALLHGDNRSQQLTEKGDLFGSASVMAPEIFQAAHQVDALTNVYSIGCIMYFAVSGKYPYRAPNWMATLHKHANSTPEPLFPAGPKTSADNKIEEVITRAMSKDRKERYQSLSELSKALQEVME